MGTCSRCLGVMPNKCSYCSSGGIQKMEKIRKKAAKEREKFFNHMQKGMNKYKMAEVSGEARLHSGEVVTPKNGVGLQYNYHPRSGSLDKLYIPGTIIWRECGFIKNQVNIISREVQFEDGMGKIGLGNWTSEPYIHDYRNDETQEAYKGVICHVDLDSYIENWTHLLVQKCVDNHVYAKYDRVGIEEFNKFRLELQRKYSAFIKGPQLFEELISLSNSVWPCGLDKNNSRLIIQSSLGEDCLYQYRHINKE